MTRIRAAALVSCSFAACMAAAASAGTDVYRKAPTVSCLRGKNVAVAAIKPSDRRLRALRDLAQKTSWQATLRKGVVGVAIGRNANDAELLVELLSVPNDRYRLERRANAVLLYRPTAATLAKTVRNCLA